MELSLAGANAGVVNISDDVFGVDFNESLIHQAVTAYLAGGRAGTRAQKTRSEVSGGGAKPWRQKGTGRARAGTSRSPIWRSGGVSFAAKTQDHSQKINKKMYRGALRSIFSELIRQERLVVVESLSLDAPKTRDLVAKLADLNLQDVLIITNETDKNVYLSARNLVKVDVIEVAGIDPVSLVSFDKVLITADALQKVEEKLA